jgi:hypothetical protein
MLHAQNTHRVQTPGTPYPKGMHVDQIMNDVYWEKLLLHKYQETQKALRHKWYRPPGWSRRSRRVRSA